MQLTKITGLRAGATLLAVAVAAATYLGGQAPGAERATAIADEGLSGDRTTQAREAEADIARTNLAGRMTTALGDAFAGVWFEPSTAQLHVGVVSDAGQRLVEGVAARAGLSAIVMATPVSSTWGQLEDAQQRWNRRLADLLERSEASTALAPDANAVQVTLGSSVTSARRAQLERAADDDGAAVAIEARQRPLSPARDALQCAKWEKFIAFCDPHIVAGVVVDSEEVGGKILQSCSAGPAAILANRDQKEAATNTYVLTAGHCIEKGGGEGKIWYAYNKEGEVKGKKELGTAGPFLNAQTDVGAVLVNRAANYWVKDKDPIPLVPKVALWAGAEHDPTVVKKQIPPVKGAKTCFSGQRSGKVCGTIENASMTFKFEGEPVATERLSEVKLAGGKTGGKRDSGGPFYSEATPSSVEGTMVGFSGGNAEEGPIVYFHSLEASFETLGKEKAFTLELLTEAKEKRHGKFKAGKYPVTVHGTTTGGEKFVTEAGTVECKQDTYHGTLAAESSTLTLSPVYKTCTAFGFAATVESEECTHVLHVNEKVSTDNYRSAWDVSCPAGKSIKTVAGTCKFEVQTQSGRELVDLIDDTTATPKKDITFRPTVTGIAYGVTQDGFGCPFNGVGEKTGAQYTSNENITLTGQSTTEPAEKIDVEVAD